MGVTARDIAATVGISQSTVSRILNDDRGHRISSATRARVLEVAGQLGYQPNAIARSLRSGRTHIVGLYTSHRYDARNDFLGEILGGLQHGCARNGLDLLLHIGGTQRGYEQIYNGVRDGRVDGLFLHTSPDDPLVARLSASDLPVVAIADPLPDLPSVTCDDRAGMRAIVGYLWAKRYRSFAFVAPVVRLASVERRLAAWQEALWYHGLRRGDERVFRVAFEDAGPVLDCLDLPRSAPCAVTCWNDRTAYALLRACQAREHDVPGQIGVTGFDGFLDDKLPARRLVTVGCPWADAAALATEILVRHIRGEPIDRETCLPVSFVDGDTA